MILPRFPAEMVRPRKGDVTCISLSICRMSSLRGRAVMTDALKKLLCTGLGVAGDQPRNMLPSACDGIRRASNSLDCLHLSNSFDLLNLSLTARPDRGGADSGRLDVTK